MKKYSFLFFLLIIIPINAQKLNERELDALYNSFLRMRETAAETNKPDIIKCGLGIVSEIKQNLWRYSKEKQQSLKIMLDRPERDTSIISPLGLFRIHFNLTGSERPNYNPMLSALQNAAETAKAADSAYNFEVNFLGYPPPPPDNSAGGDNLCDIYISNIGGTYGFTVPEEALGDEKYTSYVQIHNSFKGFPTEGLDAMHVTVAHEFHHTIQLGNYILRYEDLFFHELTSVSMEEFVYNSVNDYYFYMPHYFNNPGKTFGAFPGGTVDGYDLAIWNIFMKDKFGFGIIKRQWQLMPQMRALEAISQSLIEAGTSFGSKLSEFGVWTFFTNFRTIKGEYFEEAEHYPVIKSTVTIQFNSQAFNGLAAPASNNFITFVNSTDTITTILTNADFESGVNNMNAYFDYQYILSSSLVTGSTKLTDNYYAKLNVSQPALWTVAEILNYQLIRQNGNIYSENPSKDLYAYPNPFFYSKAYSNLCNCIEIIIDPGKENEAYLNIYTSSMEAIYKSSSPLPVENNSFGRKILRWYIRDIPEKLSTGVYIYAVKLGNQISLGKLVIFN
jgi:hypothetical protein